MLKNELISELKNFLGVYNRYDQTCYRLRTLNQKLAEYKRPPVPKMKAKYLKRIIGWSIAGFFLVGVIWFIFLLVFADSFASLSDGLKNFVVLLPLIVGVALGAAYAIVHTSNENKQIGTANQTAKDLYQKQQKLIPGLTQQINAVAAEKATWKTRVEAQGRRCGLHPNYQNGYIVENLIEYLETGRADTLKEALNLYEKEESDYRREQAEAAHRAAMEQVARQQAQQLDAIYQETQRQTAAAEDAADAAHDAAFWSAAGAFMTANEIDRQRRKDS